MKNNSYMDYSPKNNSIRAQQNALVRAHKQLSSSAEPSYTSTNRNARRVTYNSEANKTVDFGTALKAFRDGLNARSDETADPADRYVKQAMSRKTSGKAGGAATFQQKITKAKD